MDSDRKWCLNPYTLRFWYLLYCMADFSFWNWLPPSKRKWQTERVKERNEEAEFYGPCQAVSLFSLWPNTTPTNPVIDTYISNNDKYCTTHKTYQLNSSAAEKEMIWDYRSFLGSGVCLHALCILWKRSIFICSICLQTAACPRQAVLSTGFCSVPSALWPVCSYHSILFLNPIRTSF